MQHRGLSWMSIVGVALAALTMLILSAPAPADTSGPEIPGVLRAAPQQDQYRPVSPSPPPLPARPQESAATGPAGPPPAASIWPPVAVVVATLLLLAIFAETVKRLWQRRYQPRPVRIALVRDTGRQRMVVTGPGPAAPVVSVRLHTSGPATRLRRAA